MSARRPPPVTLAQAELRVYRLAVQLAGLAEDLRAAAAAHVLLAAAPPHQAALQLPPHVPPPPPAAAAPQLDPASIAGPGDRHFAVATDTPAGRVAGSSRTKVARPARRAAAYDVDLVNRRLDEARLAGRSAG